MKIAFISDIHSNYHAIQAVMAYIQQEKAERIYCAGDIVGYCAQPNECIDLLREAGVVAVKGNHDMEILNAKEPDNFSGPARDAITWQRGIVTKKNLKYIKNLPFTLVTEDEVVLVTHGSPVEPEEFKYVLDELDVREAFMAFEEQVCVIGHTHAPAVYRYDIKNRSHEEIFAASFKIQEGFKYIINVGSVGQPRDYNPKACVYIYDTDKKVFTRTRVTYDIAATQDTMMQAALPHVLVERLEEGA